MSHALPLSNLSTPSSLAEPSPRSAVSGSITSGAVPSLHRPLAVHPSPLGVPAPTLRRPDFGVSPAAAPVRITPPPIPRTTPERMQVARERIRTAAEAGQRIRSYEVALDLDLSEFHFARQFRAAFGRSPHVYYDEVRAGRARELLGEGHGEGEVARRVGFRRPAELRALLAKRPPCA